MTGQQDQPVFIRLGPPSEEPNQFVVEGAPQSYSPEVRARLEVDAKEIIGRYPNKRSALLPVTQSPKAMCSLPPSWPVFRPPSEPPT